MRARLRIVRPLPSRRLTRPRWRAAQRRLSSCRTTRAPSARPGRQEARRPLAPLISASLECSTS
eukprot:14808171-Alexandrium_andersonii.AAC.1